ncbi:MAG: peptidylprolyl isomerase [Deltaproteobacteria bacterium]|nr:peptidylprolyl isomerase [Deltaproteobacteria bacterium]
MILRNAIITLLLVPLLFSSSPAQGELLDRIVAMVNNDIIILSDLDEMYLPYANRIRADGYAPEKEKEFLFEARKEILNRLIEQKLADQEISAKKIRVSDDEVDNAVERVKNENFCTEEELVKILAGDGYTLKDYRALLREQILRSKLVNREVKSKIVVTEHEIRECYNEHQESYKGKIRYHIASLFLMVSPSDDEGQVEAVIRRGENIIKRIRGGLRFEDAAKEFSEAESAANGGDLGFFTLDELTPALKDVVQGLQPGEISPVLRTPAGIQIIKLVKKEDMPGKSFEEAKAEIHRRLFQSVVDKKYEEWVQGLRERAYIKIML